MLETAIRVDSALTSSSGPEVAWSARAGRHLRSALMAVGVVMLVPLFIVVLPLLLAWRAVRASTS